MWWLRSVAVVPSGGPVVWCGGRRVVWWLCSGPLAVASFRGGGLVWWFFSVAVVLSGGFFLWLSSGPVVLSVLSLFVSFSSLFFPFFFISV